MRNQIIRPLLALGLASATVTGGLLMQPHRGGEGQAAIPAPSDTQAPTATPETSWAGSIITEEAISPSPSSDTSSASAVTKTKATDNQTSASRRRAKAPSSQAPSSATSTAAPSSAKQATTASQGQSQAQIDGWTIDYFDGFDVPIEQTQWERYGWGDPPVGHGAMGVMSQRNSFTQDGKLIIRTQYQDGQWSAGGAGSRNIFSASGGRWEVRAKFPQAKGIGYVFLLWPEDGSWPPEIDFAEGRVNGPEVMGVYHWDSDNKQAHRFFDNHDMSGWHTYGVIVERDHIIFTLDGAEWGRIEHPNVTDKRMWVGFQTGAMDPNGWQNKYETVDNGVPGPLTPAVSDIEIDYVAHYTKS